MKLAPLLLATSLGLNAAGVAAFVLRPALAPKAVRELLGVVTPEEAAEKARAERATQAERAAASAAAAEAARPLWSRLQTEDLRALVARLRAAGFSPVVVRGIVDAEVSARFDGRIRAIHRERDQTPFWRQAPFLSSGSKPLEDLNQIFRERSRLIRDLLGTEGYAYGTADLTAAQRRQYGDLPQSKIDLIQRINDDYQEMMGQVRAAMQGVTLPEDREKLALLEREKRADLAAILTPAELADYEMRSSTITSRLRTTLTVLNASEAEFRAIYAAQVPYAEQLYPTASAGLIQFGDQRREATARVNEQIKIALGPERFADYLRANNYEFQQLHRIAQNHNIPADAVGRAFDARSAAATSSTAIMSDRALSAEQRQAALQAVAQTARTTILSNLGPAAGPTHIQNSNWLTFIERGGSISVSPEGSLTYRNPPSANPPPPR